MNTRKKHENLMKTVEVVIDFDKFKKNTKSNQKR